MKTDAAFDWVQARHDCSSQEVFKLLEMEAKANVAKRNELPHDGYGFKFIVNSSSDFSVLREANKSFSASVSFALDKNCIVVQDTKHNDVMRATLTLNKDRECRLSVDGEEYERWRFLCKALEKLFFQIEPDG